MLRNNPNFDKLGYPMNLVKDKKELMEYLWILKKG